MPASSRHAGEREAIRPARGPALGHLGGGAAPSSWRRTGRASARWRCTWPGGRSSRATDDRARAGPLSGLSRNLSTVIPGAPEAQNFFLSKGFSSPDVRGGRTQPPSRGGHARRVVRVVFDVRPFQPLALGDVALELDVLREAERKIARGRARRPRASACPRRRSRPRRPAPRPVFRFRLAVAATSERKPVGAPVGSWRSAALATEMPSSSPIMWIGR